MLIEYVEYLRQLDKKLKREGIVLPVNLDCDKEHLSEQVTVLEQFLFFNDVLCVADSQCKISSLLGFDNIGLMEFLRNQIYEKYEAEWNKRLKELVKQPADAGIIDKPIKVLSKREIKLFNDALNLSQEGSSIEEEVPNWGSNPWSRSTVYEFDEEEETSEEDNVDFSDYEYDDETQDKEGSYDVEENSDEDFDDFSTYDSYNEEAENNSFSGDGSDLSSDDSAEDDLSVYEYESDENGSEDSVEGDDSDDYDAMLAYENEDNSEDSSDSEGSENAGYYDYDSENSSEYFDDFSAYDSYSSDEESTMEDDASSDEDGFDDLSCYEEDTEESTSEEDGFDDLSCYEKDDRENSEDIFEDDSDDFSAYDAYSEDDTSEESSDSDDDDFDFSQYDAYGEDETDTSESSDSDDGDDLSCYYDEYADENLSSLENVPFGGINSSNERIITSRGKPQSVIGTYPQVMRAPDKVVDELQSSINKGLTSLFNKRKG